MGQDCLMPMVARPRTKPDGSAFTIDDREYWHRERDGGIRRNEVTHMAYPKMLYRGRRGAQGTAEYETKIVDTSAEHKEAEPFGWVDHPETALKSAEQQREAVAEAAAEAAAAAQTMSAKAKAEYDEESAENPEHVTDVPRKPGRPRKVVEPDDDK